MKVINFSEQNTVINNYLAELRDIDVQKNRAWFRQNLRRIGHAMAYEVSKTLNYSHKTLQTPLAPAKVSTIDDRIVIGTVLRAGLALHEGFLEVFSDADSAFVSAYRKEGRKDDIEICVEYIASPNLDGSTFMLVDPMLATGGSFNLAYQAYLTKGTPKKLHICAVIGCEEGVARLKELFPSDDVTLWIAAVDPILNEQAYIVPGLGDAGDLCYGDKLSD
ncbi:MAG: uracil phosphoribosyltransferase [Alloprevotella sp.]|jgi:uracil phosphoribosyltransferase|nr:uracil phosphoribosyltransferase [Alloprevotella sp.]MBF0965043.1 uracil phosphoribosyltransferase [Alloprevotella sp.]RKV78541.1 MAG: uracil phosphoribosyltransferase [Alloprevotella sp.]